jgi:hypothetical protein
LKAGEVKAAKEKNTYLGQCPLAKQVMKWVGPVGGELVGAGVETPCSYQEFPPLSFTSQVNAPKPV